MTGNRTAEIIGAFGLGVFVGAVAALLLAPASGEVTRRRIGRLAEQTTDKAKEGVEKVTDFVKDQRKRVESGVKEGIEAYRS